ncbi:MAG: response regulator, partial [Cystobacter sp.]
MRVLLVDDEEPARRRLSRLLGGLPDVEVVGDAGDGEEALQRVAELRPDLVLLDVHMPGMDGLALAQRYRELPPLLFITAHDDYAIQAFEAHAVDYLLKPVRPERLADAIERARKRLLSNQAAVSRVLEAVAPVEASCRVVTVSQGAFHFFDARSVSRFWSSDKYTLFLVDQREQCTEEPLTQL